MHQAKPRSGKYRDFPTIFLLLPDDSIWVFPKIGISQNGWFIMENPIKMDDFGGKTTIFGNTYMGFLLQSASFLQFSSSSLFSFFFRFRRASTAMWIFQQLPNLFGERPLRVSGESGELGPMAQCYVDSNKTKPHWKFPTSHNSGDFFSE